MEQIIEMLTPWAKPVMVFCGALFNAFKQQNVI